MIHAASFEDIALDRAVPADFVPRKAAPGELGSTDGPSAGHALAQSPG